MNQESFYSNQRLLTTNSSQSPFTRSLLNNSDGFLNNQPIYQKNEYEFFHHTPNDDNFYLITCKIILNDSIPSDDYGYDGYDYDYGFFYQRSATNYYIMCKLFSHSSIMNILNKKIYG